jgi:peptidoglycan hydrolase-like amidase
MVFWVTPPHSLLAAYITLVDTYYSISECDYRLNVEEVWSSDMLPAFMASMQITTQIKNCSTQLTAQLSSGLHDSFPR